MPFLPPFVDMVRRAGPADLVGITTRSLHVRADTINLDERSVEAVIATERVTRVFDPESFRVIDEVLLAKGADLPEQIIMLDSHIRWGTEWIRGSIKELRVEGDQVVGRIFFASNERSEEDWNLVREGHLTDISVGYRVKDWHDIKANTTETVNGKSYTAAERTLRISTSWRPREGSLTAIGADEAAKIRESCDAGGRSAPSSSPSRPESATMNPQLRAYLESLGLRKEATEPEARAHLAGLNAEQQRHAQTFTDDPPGDPPADPPPQRTAPVAPAPVVPAPDLARAPVAALLQTPPVAAPDAATVIAQERQRVVDIQALGREHPDVPVEVVEACCRDDTTVTAAGGLFLAAMRDARTPAVAADRAPAGIVRMAADELPVRALIAGLKHRAGITVIDPDASETVQQQQQRELEMGERFADCSMIEIVDHSLRFMGVTAPHTREDRFRAAIEASRFHDQNARMRGVDPLVQRAAGGSSTGSLVGIFSNIADARLLMSFQEAPDSTRGWVNESDVADFKTTERTRLGKTSNMEKLARGDEAKHATIDDVVESYKLARYAKQFVIDEQDVIDDRFDALLRMPMEMGNAAARLRPDLIYAILLGNPDLADGTALFHASLHGGNLITDVLADAGLRTGIQVMGKQVEGDAKLNMIARFLIVPVDLKHTALQLLRSIELRPGASTPAGQEGTFNPLSTENIEPRSDNRIGVAGVTDPSTGTVFAGTAANWVLVASPLQGPTIEVGYLRGRNRRPVMRAFVLDKGRWGIGFDVNHDIEAQAMAFHGLVKSTGAG